MLKNQAEFIRLISDIRLDMKVKMADCLTHQTITYPNVSLFRSIYVNTFFPCRIFVNENTILITEEMLKICAVCFILVIKKQKNHQV